MSDFLKEILALQMFVVVALDANDYIYPIAHVVVEIENVKSWKWFISDLSEELRILTSNEWTFMTDR